jgi:hypothetical protein
LPSTIGRSGGGSATSATGAFIGSTSHGASSATGPGRPDFIRQKASAKAAGASPGWLMRADHLVRPRSVCNWSGSSWSCPLPWPIRCDMMLPVTHKTGVLAA